MRCLWINRIIPFPVISGDRLYTGKLAQSLAEAGADITFMGFDGGKEHPPVSRIDWITVPGGPRSQLHGLFSMMPLVAARHRTPAFVQSILDQVQDPNAWDVLIVDQYGMGWVVDLLSEEFKKKAVIVFIAHDHEESVMRSLWQNSSNSISRKAFLLMNYLQTRAIERNVVAASDLVTTITASDAELFKGSAETLTLTPGYSGSKATKRLITSQTPRRVVMFGSLHWSAKQENLRQFLDAADQDLHRAAIQVQLVGDIPADFAHEIGNKYLSTDIVGYVDDATPYLHEARLAVLAEPIGGGFKMKMLDYIFNGVPLLALDECVSGLPASVSRHIFQEPDIPALVRRLVNLIDDLEALNDAQNQALFEAQLLFNWKDRGDALLAGINRFVAAKRPSALAKDSLAVPNVPIAATK